jgi:hypothetical protein
VEAWDDWDSVMQEDYLAELDLTLGEELVMEIRRHVMDTTHPSTDITHQ